MIKNLNLCPSNLVYKSRHQISLFFILILFAILLNNLNSIDALSCVDEQGKSVDYYVGYKVPKLEKNNDNLVKNGLRYVYYLNKSGSIKEWIHSTRSINDSKSLLGATLRPLLNSKSSNINFIVYNDQKPTTRTRPTSTGAHAKGVLATYGKTGFWLMHSIPQFPVMDSQYEYPKRSLNNGQAFICISISTEDKETMENIAQHLLMINPNIYAMDLSKTFLQKYPIFEDLKKPVRGRRKGSKRLPHTVTVIQSTDRTKFVVFSKSNKYNHDIYGTLIASYFKDDFFVQTWRNGAGEMLDSECKYGNKIMNVNSIKIKEGIKWPYREDHAKWAISADKSRGQMVCLADINRMKSQFGRGGGALCFRSPNLWSIFKASIYDVEGCPANKVRYPALNWLSNLSKRAWAKIQERKLKSC